MATAVNGFIQQHGGVQGVIAQLEQQGLGGVARSWISTGPNQPISADQINKAFGGSGVLGQLAAMPGVGLATLVDREGFLIEAAGEVGIGAEAAGALASCLAESSEGIGRELGRGMLQSMILDYESGMVVLHAVGPSAVLAVVLRDATALGKLRYYVKKILPDLLRAI